MRMFEVDRESERKKCGCCNWKVAKVYLMADSQEEAEKAWSENERGLCGDCMGELLVDGAYEIGNTTKGAI